MRPRLLLIALLGWAGAAHCAAASPVLQTLHSFCSLSGCMDGVSPQTPLLQDSSGNLFGVTSSGGSGGVVFELRRNGTGYGFKTLHSFCSLASCADGNLPLGGLILDVNGALYGSASSGGAHDGGVVYELTPGRSGRKWKFRVLYDLCALANCADGGFPRGALSYQGVQSGALYDGVSPLYGSTASGGPSDVGVAFQLTRHARRTTEKVIYEFCSLANCSDGSQPTGTLLPDASGNLFGMAIDNIDGHGLLFELKPRHRTYANIVLHKFCVSSGCPDGDSPRDGLVFDGAGDLIGTTQRGGTHDGNGVLFKVVPNGANSQETVLYDFCAQANCADGNWPMGNIAVAPNGDLYGVTTNGGTGDNGTAFLVHNGVQSVIYRFCALSGCADGRNTTSIMLGASGDLFGATDLGGAHDDGTLFELTP